jgi:DNA repair protein RadC
MKHALENLASFIVLCHNHPSGNLNPSDADLSITKKLVQAARTLDLDVVDHIIVANNKYYSLGDNNQI